MPKVLEITVYRKVVESTLVFVEVPDDFDEKKDLFKHKGEIFKAMEPDAYRDWETNEILGVCDATATLEYREPPDLRLTYVGSGRVKVEEVK